MNNLYEKKTYLAPVSYCIDDNIYEYDMRKANISVLYEKGILTKSQYDMYFNWPKEARQIKIGLLLRAHPEYNKILQDGICEAKRMFFEANNISNEDILAIKNDAVFLINRIPKVTKFGALEFICKNTYTSFYKINNLELYYFYSFITKEEKLDIKGMGEYAYSLHSPYFIDFLKVLFCSAQLDPIQEVLGLLQDFHYNYINNKLPLGYYREFNNLSKYRVIPIKGSLSSYIFEDYSITDIKYLDKSFNENILSQLYMIYNSLGITRI